MIQNYFYTPTRKAQRSECQVSPEVVGRKNSASDKEAVGLGTGRERQGEEKGKGGGSGPFPGQTPRLRGIGNKQKNWENVQSSERHVMIPVWELRGDFIPGCHITS